MIEQKIVVAQTKEHRGLVDKGWKPVYAYQGFNTVKKCRNLKPETELYVVMKYDRP